MLKSIEICAGAGGQALGLERAGFNHVALIEYEKEYCGVLKSNRPNWNVICDDIKNFSGLEYRNKIDLLAGGVPCQPYTVAGEQKGSADERDLFPEALRLIEEINPRAVMIENVRGFLTSEFDELREYILKTIESLGYNVQIKLLNASDYGVPQLRPRIVIVGIRKDIKVAFTYPEPTPDKAQTVAETLADLMGENNWNGLDEWVKTASDIAPTIVGGSKKHGGPDLGPVRAKKAWAKLGVDGNGIANEAPAADFEGMPKLTFRMVARIQGFPDSWYFGTKKTAACRMIGNAFPPPVAQAVGEEIRKVLNMDSVISTARKNYHKNLLEKGILTVDSKGIPSNADKSSKVSIQIAKGIADRLMAETHNKKVGQTAGAMFEEVNRDFLLETFPKLQNLRPGNWHIIKLGNRNKIKTSHFSQYEHLEYLAELTQSNAKLSTCIGNDYMVAPDIVIYRDLEPDSVINGSEVIVDDTVSKMSDLRKDSDSKLPILHASISAKWTIRSDRAQNSRTEALGLIRNRKGRTPHIAVITGEPLPGRLASLALGTGDIDCVYHFALYELIEAVKETGKEESIEMLNNLIEGKRLKDISDLPLDLAI